MFSDKFRKKDQNEKVVVSPYVNIYEQDNNLVLAVEMPGVDKSTLDIELNHDQLSIRAQSKKGDVDKQYSPVYRERMSCEYYRVFELNSEIDREKISAAYEDGILKVILPRSQAALPKKIEIKS